MPSKYVQAHPRARGRLMARYSAGSFERTAFTTNLSIGGAFLRTNQVHRPGTDLRLELCAGTRKIALSARVVWAKKVPPQMAQVLLCGMGLRFVNPGPDWREFYEDWATRHALGPVTK